jgi:hypothetical protein
VRQLVWPLLLLLLLLLLLRLVLARGLPVAVERASVVRSVQCLLQLAALLQVLVRPAQVAYQQQQQQWRRRLRVAAPRQP